MLNSNLIKQTHFTEKTQLMSSLNTYCFTVAKECTKTDAKKILETVYESKVLSIRVVGATSKMKIKKGKKVVSKKPKKIYVRFNSSID